MSLKIKKSGRLFSHPEAVMRRHLEAGMSEIAAYGEKVIKQKTPKGHTRALVADIAGEWKKTASGLRSRWGTSLIYGKVVEEGRRPGRRPPPSEALEPWVRRILRVPRSQVKSVSFIIARSIGKKGIPAKGMFSKSVDTIERFSRSHLLKRIKLITKELSR